MRSSRGGSPAAPRERNKRLMLESLLEAPHGLTRPELALALGVTVPAIAGLVQSNGESLADVVREEPADPRDERSGSTGPTPKVVRLRDRLGYVVGIFLSHTQIHVAIADLQGKYVRDPGLELNTESYDRGFDVEGDLHGALAWATEAAARLAEARAIRPQEIAAIGLAIAAPVNVFSDAEPSERRGRLRVDLGGRSSWLNVDPLAALANHLAALEDGEHWSTIPLHVDNDANLGALAELKTGAARGKQDVFYVHLDEGGIGSGLVFDGSLYRGAGGVAGELGHVVLDPDGPSCARCGRTCVEAKVLSMLALQEGATLEQLVHDAILAKAEHGADAAKGDARLADAMRYLGRAISVFATLLNFDRILIGGPFPRQAYGLVVPLIQEALADLVITPAARDYVVELGSLGQRAILDGAVWLALERGRVDYLLARAARRGQRGSTETQDAVAPARARRRAGSAAHSSS